MSDVTMPKSAFENRELTSAGYRALALGRASGKTLRTTEVADLAGISTITARAVLRQLAAAGLVRRVALVVPTGQPAVGWDFRVAA